MSKHGGEASFAALVEVVASRLVLTKKTTRAVIATFSEALAEAVWRNGRVVVPGLGAFQVKTRKARRIRNPSTAQLMTLEPRRAVTARVATEWRSRR